MPVTQAQIIHIAHRLSGLSIDASDIPVYERDMNAIIGYIDHIGQLPDMDTIISSVPLTLQPVADIVRSENTSDTSSLLSQSPKKIIGNHIVIDGIL